MNANNGQGFTIGKNTGVSLGIILMGLMILGGLVANYLQINEKFHQIDSRLLAIERGTSDRWTRQDMQVWSLKLEKENREQLLVVPDPDAISRARRQ